MMSTVDIDSASDFRKKHTLSPNVLLLTLSDNSSTENQRRHISCSSPMEVYSHQQEKHQTTPHMVDLHVDNSLLLSYAWQRQSNKVEQLAPAPDIAYRYTYLEKPKRKKSAPMSNLHHSYSSSSRSSSTHSQHSAQQSFRLKTASSSSSSSYNISDSSQRTYPQQHRSVYEYIHQSIREIERKRNFKQENFSRCMKRPLNDDVVLRHVLSEKRYSTTPIKGISISRNDLRNTQNISNYINHSYHVLRTTTPNNF